MRVVFECVSAWAFSAPQHVMWSGPYMSGLCSRSRCNLWPRTFVRNETLVNKEKCWASWMAKNVEINCYKKRANVINESLLIHRYARTPHVPAWSEQVWQKFCHRTNSRRNDCIKMWEKKKKSKSKFGEYLGHMFTGAYIGVKKYREIIIVIIIIFI